MNKYRAKPTTIDGIRFASKREAKRYGELKLLDRAKKISGLVLQPRYALVVNGKVVGHYTPDFFYRENMAFVVEDVKSPASRTEAYRLRTKLFCALYPEMVFRETS